MDERVTSRRRTQRAQTGGSAAAIVPSASWTLSSSVAPQNASQLRPPRSSWGWTSPSATDRPARSRMANVARAEPPSSRLTGGLPASAISSRRLIRRAEEPCPSCPRSETAGSPMCRSPADNEPSAARVKIVALTSCCHRISSVGRASAARRPVVCGCGHEPFRIRAAVAVGSCRFRCARSTATDHRTGSVSSRPERLRGSWCDGLCVADTATSCRASSSGGTGRPTW